jgi:hypothetical protein
MQAVEQRYDDTGSAEDDERLPIERGIQRVASIRGILASLADLQFSSGRVKPLYDRRCDEVCLDEVDRNAIKGGGFDGSFGVGQNTHSASGGRSVDRVQRHRVGDLHCSPG